MRFNNIPSSLLISILLLFHLVPARPSIGRRASLYDIISRRTPYSVVPVDGGANENGGDNSGQNSPDSPKDTPDFTTIPIAAPQTSVETDTVTLPPLTNYLTSTTIIEGPTITQVTEITITPAAIQTITRTSYSVINISSPTQALTSSSEISSGVAPEPTNSPMFPSSFQDPTPDSSTRMPESDPSAPRMTIPSTSTANSTHSRPSGPTSSLHLYFTPSYPANSSSVAYSQSRNLVVSAMTTGLSALPSP